MICSDLNFNNEEPIYIQIENNIKEMIEKGRITSESKLPSSRELGKLLGVSRNSVISAYENLEANGYIYTLKGKGTFVAKRKSVSNRGFNVDWNSKRNNYGKTLEELDIIKTELVWKKGMISFKSIAPDETLFDTEEVKKGFLNRMSIEGNKLLNYGYAQGYKPLIELLLKYMKEKGAKIDNKDILITNGFTEGLDIVLATYTKPGDTIICENPTHNTAIKIMKSYGLKVIGVKMNSNGIDLEDLDLKLKENKVKMGYLIPSYHNPTGIVMDVEKRYKVYDIFKKYNVPIIEDGFNEELLYSSSHVLPLVALEGDGNSIIYIGSFSKILFPGIRLGFILGDKSLISTLESVKRGRTIHCSFLDQAIFYEYLNSGVFSKYIKKARKHYKEKYEFTLAKVKEYIPYEEVFGEGGLHLFIKLKDINARKVLDKSYEKGVVFTPGDIFYLDGSGRNTFRIGFSRLSDEEITEGIKLIGQSIEEVMEKESLD
ncbi:PLP-dependent aminotransferase family protein [Clostridium cavendishii]|uniref:MocR-like pyridoxine biosynthesis transcription factor PdxR n=1 Tax=Clostridium cavendishii TaxID=349931 RepID=UPI000934A830|nr:PLP-dependent aminotransferase family protein [Clostridium cavendishii]